jgi:hypothetical protein
MRPVSETEMFRKVMLVRDARMVDANENVLWEGQALKAEMYAPLLNDVGWREVVIQVPGRRRAGTQSDTTHWDNLEAELKAMYAPLRRAGVSKDRVFQCACLLMDARETLTPPVGV